MRWAQPPREQPGPAVQDGQGCLLTPILFSCHNTRRWHCGWNIGRQKPLPGPTCMTQAQRSLVGQQQPKALDLSYVQHKWEPSTITT